MDFLLFTIEMEGGGRYNIMMYGFERPYVDFRALFCLACGRT